MVCEKWELRFSMRKARDYREFMQYTADNFSDKLVMLILEKLELLRKDPLKYAREKLGEDKYNNTMFSIEVTRDIRILYSVDSKSCIVFIWEIGSHKKVYGRDP
ncbi:MAG: type II toxin-antitoxin system RelE/ParE family toxin [Acidianus sp.]